MTRKLTLNEAADLLQLRPQTIYNWCSAKKIPYLKVGGRLRFDEREIEEWLNRFRVHPKDTQRKNHTDRP